MLSHIQEERRRPRRCVSSARVSCVILFVTVSSFDDGWTSASDRRNIPVCQTWNYTNASRDSCLLHLTRFQKTTRTGVMLQTFLQSFQTREKSSGKVRMSSVMFPLICLENKHETVRRKNVFLSRIWQIWGKKKKSCPRRGSPVGMRGELQLCVQWGHCWCERIPQAISGKATCGNRLIPLKRNKHSSPLMA